MIFHKCLQTRGKFQTKLLFKRSLIPKMDQQAAGGEDPNKPPKKKSSEDESKNKKLVCIIFPGFILLVLLLSYVKLSVRFFSNISVACVCRRK